MKKKYYCPVCKKFVTDFRVGGPGIYASTAFKFCKKCGNKIIVEVKGKKK